MLVITLNLKKKKINYNSWRLEVFLIRSKKITLMLILERSKCANEYVCYNLDIYQIYLRNYSTYCVVSEKVHVSISNHVFDDGYMKRVFM